MAQHFIGGNRGTATFLRPNGLVGGNATTGSDMEIRWDDTKGITREDLFLFVEAVEYAINSQTFVPFVPKN
jgi:hypothetical protein